MLNCAGIVLLTTERILTLVFSLYHWIIYGNKYGCNLYP